MFSVLHVFVWNEVSQMLLKQNLYTPNTHFTCKHTLIHRYRLKCKHILALQGGTHWGKSDWNAPFREWQWIDECMNGKTLDHFDSYIWIWIIYISISCWYICLVKWNFRNHFTDRQAFTLHNHHNVVCLCTCMCVWNLHLHFYIVNLFIVHSKELFISILSKHSNSTICQLRDNYMRCCKIISTHFSFFQAVYIFLLLPTYIVFLLWGGFMEGIQHSRHAATDS